MTQADLTASLLPYFVYEVFDRVFPDDEVLYSLRAGFKSEELAQDFINYQATISSRKFIIDYQDKTIQDK